MNNGGVGNITDKDINNMLDSALSKDNPTAVSGKLVELCPSCRRKKEVGKKCESCKAKQ